MVIFFSVSFLYFNKLETRQFLCTKKHVGTIVQTTKTRHAFPEFTIE